METSANGDDPDDFLIYRSRTTILGAKGATERLEFVCERCGCHWHRTAAGWSRAHLERPRTLNLL